jgi:F-type H+-transporting ATPase subunit delta
MIRSFARPYARAFMEVVPDLPKAQAMHAELIRFEEARKGSPELMQIFANPGVSADAKTRIADAIAKRLGLSDLAVRIIHVLIQNHRVNQMGSVLQAWQAMINERLGVEVAEVRSAHPLSEAERKELKAALERKLGKRIELQVETDPALLGGFVAKVGSDVYDASVVGQIHRFQASI